MNSKLKITILTPSYNQGEFIEQTIKSVLNQDYGNIEHIVIDGGSTDNTVEILKKYPHLKWVSEKDEGQSDALNKGLTMATGDILGWLNSDDFYEENIFTNVISHFKDTNVQWIIGDSSDYFMDLNLFRKVKSREISYEILLKDSGRTRQPPTFFRRKILEEVKGIDKSLNYVMDYDLWIRLSKISKPKMIDKSYALFRIHEDQKTTKNNIMGQIKELNSILKREKVSFLKRRINLFKKRRSYLKYLIKTVLIKNNLMNKKYLNMNFSSRNW